MDIKRDYSEINISPDKGVDINEDMIGLFYEDISYAADGAALDNQAYEGVYVEKDKVYHFSVWAKKGNYNGEIKVSVTKDGTTYLDRSLEKKIEGEYGLMIQRYIKHLIIMYRNC